MSLPQWFAAREQKRGGSRAENRDRRLSSRLLGRKVAATLQRNSQDLEVLGRDLIVGNANRWATIGRCSQGGYSSSYRYRRNRCDPVHPGICGECIDCSPVTVSQ